MTIFEQWRITFPPKAASYVLPAFAGITAVAIFVADTLTGLEIAMPVFYTAVVLMAVRFLRGQRIILVGVGCIGLTLFSDLLTVDDSISTTGVINTAISIAAIAITTYLALNIESKTTAVYETRAQLAHVARVSTLGELAASIAHEINQPLAATVLNGNACLRWLAGNPPDLKEARLAVKRIVSDATRAGEIISRVRTLTNNTPSKMELISLNDAVGDAIGFVESAIENHRVSFRLDLASDLPRLLADRVQLQQIVLNLILNAIDSLNGVGDGSRELLVKTQTEDSATVSISVEDNGIGLPPVEIDRLFDAFYTTKSGGMGMGLAISRSIAEAHGGRILAMKRLPRGSIFRLELPTAG